MFYVDINGNTGCTDKFKCHRGEDIISCECYLLDDPDKMVHDLKENTTLFDNIKQFYYLCNFSVPRDQQRKGLGTKTLLKMFDLIKQHNTYDIHNLFLLARPTCHDDRAIPADSLYKFYEKMGFCRVCDIYITDGFIIPLFHKKL